MFLFLFGYSQKMTAVRRQRRMHEPSGELQSAARGGGELPTSYDVEVSLQGVFADKHVYT